MKKLLKVIVFLFAALCVISAVDDALEKRRRNAAPSDGKAD